MTGWVTKEPQHNAHAEALGFVPHPNLLHTSVKPYAYALPLPM
jgi:hypothetical protein